VHLLVGVTQAASQLTKHGARLNELARELGVPGASLAIWKDGELIQHATGVVNRRTGVDVTPDAIFQIGSITKLMTATLVMQLVDEGLVRLDDRLADHVPGFAVADSNVSRALTIEQLLTHTSGLDGDFFENTGIGDDKVERFVLACRALPTLHPPGELFSYCNVGFNLLGRLVELKRGGTWESTIKRRLFDKLGAASFVRYAEETLRYRAAIGHSPPAPAGDGDIVKVPYLAKSSAPAGSVLYAATRDLVAFGRTVLNEGISPNGSVVLRPESLHGMLEPRISLPAHGMCSAFGLAFMLFDWDGHRIVGHDGSTIGQQAFLRIVPSANAVVVLLTNGGFATELYHRLFGEIFPEAFGVAMPPRPTHGAAPADAAAWTGTYSKLSQRIAIDAEHGALVATLHGLRYGIPDQRWVLAPVDEQTCIGTTDATPTPATFHRVRDAARRDYVLFGGRVHRRD
jgi:CubicO group peptidase (beta-lactamase class C family)